MTVRVKICGLKTRAALEAGVTHGADFLGFVFYPPSPRHLQLEEAAALIAAVQGRAKSVAVWVNPDDDALRAMQRAFVPDYVQLHGMESPERVREIKKKFGVRVIKALAVRDSDDVAQAREYENVADMLLFDAQSSRNALPGGNGLAFDWALLKGREFTLPWFLSGGLANFNVAQAVQTTGARMVDVSSSLEIHPGEKDETLIAEFMRAVKNLP